MNKAEKYMTLILFGGMVLSIYLTEVTKNVDYYNFYSAFVVGVWFIVMFNILTERRQSKLIEAFTQAAKTFDSTINPDRLQSFIEAFVKKPYFVIQISEKEWWLVVPSFVTLEFGYLLAQEGAWNIFVVNQYSGMIQDIPEEFKREIELAKPFGDMENKGDDQE